MAKFPNDAAAVDKTYKVLRSSRFSSPEKMKVVFPSLDNFKYVDKWWVVDIGGNNLRLIAFIDFDKQRLFAKHLVTHAEYNKLCKKIRTGEEIMNAIAIIQPAAKLFKEAPFLVRIHNRAEYEEALALVETLLDEENEDNDFLIERLTDVIEEWEDTAHEFSAFNESIAALDGVDMLKFLMKQNGLGTAELPEIGSKSYVSKVLNRKRDLTRRHIEALSARFGVEPALFLAAK